MSYYPERTPQDSQQLQWQLQPLQQNLPSQPYAYPPTGQWTQQPSQPYPMNNPTNQWRTQFQQPLTQPSPYEQQLYQQTQFASPPSQQFSAPPSRYLSQTPLPPPPPIKQRFFKKKVTIPLWLLIFLILLSIGGLGAVAGSGKYGATGNNHTNPASSNSGQNAQPTQTTIPINNNGSTDASTPTPIPTVAPTFIPSPIGPAKVVDTLTVSGVTCTLISVKLLPDDGIVVPKAGDEFVVVHLKLINNSGSDFNYYFIDFKGKSGSGNTTDSNLDPPSTYTANNLIDSGTLSPGGTLEGDIVLEVPVDDHKAQLSWQPGFDSNTTDNDWYLGL